MSYLKTLRLFICLTIFFEIHQINGQEIQVIDSLSKQGISNVFIYNKNQNSYTTTDKKGETNISIFLDNEKVFFHLLGYKKREIIKKDIEKSDFIIKLKPQEKFLDEIILSVARSSSLKVKIAEKVSILTTKEIQLNSPKNGADLLKLGSGVRVQKSQGGGGSPVIRGFEANRVLLVVDGIRLNNAIFRSGHLQNAITIDPNYIERVEVIHGSSSVGYGSDALGGVVHYFTKNPEINSNKKIKNSYSNYFSVANFSNLNNFSNQYSSKKWGLLTSVTFSNFNDIIIGEKRFHGFENWGLTPFFYQNNSNIYQENPSDNSDPSIQKNTGYNQFDFFQKLIFLLSHNIKLNLNFQLSNSSNIPRYDKLNEYSGNSLRYSEWYYGPQKRILFSPQINFYFDKKFLKKGTITSSFQSLNESRINRKAYNFTKSFQKENVKVIGLNGDFEGSMNSNNSFSYGFEIFYNKVQSIAFSNDLIINGNKIIGYENKKEIPTRYPSNGSSYKSYAGYLNWVWDINDFMTINYGVRFTSTKLKASWKETALVNSLLSNYNINSKALTSSLGFTYRPTKKLKLNTIISSGFRNPNIDDIGKIRENNNALTVPNTSLKPEYAYNLDFGINNYFKNSNLKFRTFCTLITRYIVRSTYNIFSDTTTTDINTILYDGNELKTIANTNLGNRFIYGGSFDGNFKISNSLDLNTNITVTKAILNKKYGPMPSISPIFGSTFIKYQKNKILLNVIFKFSGSKKPNTYSFGGEDGLEETPIINSGGLITYNGSPNWKIFSLNANYKITQKVLLKLGAENIFDIHYKEFASGISSSGRNISLGLNVDF